jgi:signal transduction histidine kinase/CheY-like chemotaxis protein
MKTENKIDFTMKKKFLKIGLGLAAALILICIGGFWFYDSQKKTAEKDALTRVERIGAHQVAAVAQWRRVQLEDARKIMETPFFNRELIRFLIHPRDVHDHRLETRLSTLQTRFHYSEMWVLDSRGQVRWGRSMSTENQGLLAAAAKQAFERRQPVFAHMHRCGDDAKPCVSVVAPVFAQDPESGLPDFRPLGAMVLAREAEATLYPLLRKWPVPSNTAETLLIRRDQDEIVFLNHLALYPDTALKVRVPLDRDDVLVVMAGTGKKGVVQAKDYRGEPVVAALMPVPDSPWLLVAKQDAAEVFAQWHKKSNLLKIVFASFAGMIVIAGILTLQVYKTALYRRLYQAEALLRRGNQRHCQAMEEKEMLSAQLIQAQKMESVGRLAGGVAHDYNNMLNVILGYAEMALSELNPNDPIYARLKKIHHAASRSADITRQLLAFARKQTIDPKMLDLNETVENGVLPVLSKLMGENIDLAWRPGSDLWPVKMDPAQVDQILANLCVNARDAIDDVGKITIETGLTTFDAAYCADHPGFVPGDFVLLAVSDNGSGMDKETVKQIFEPFFTTKKAGKGTGLGLATVYGIVKQNKGFINVYSEPGNGTTVKVYLARHSAPQMSKEPVRKLPEEVSGQGETILVVEDETDILELIRTMLEQQGYRVLTAASPSEALALARRHPGPIDLLITDIVLPEMNGRDLNRHLASLFPNLKVVFMSGYTANVIAHHGVLEQGVHFIQKPFSRKDLAVKIKEALVIRETMGKSGPGPRQTAG